MSRKIIQSEREEEVIKMYVEEKISCKDIAKQLNCHLSVIYRFLNRKGISISRWESLCNRCHGLTNYNREHWKTFFQDLLAEKYSYEYTADKKIIIDLTNKYMAKR